MQKVTTKWGQTAKGCNIVVKNVLLPTEIVGSHNGKPEMKGNIHSFEVRRKKATGGRGEGGCGVKK